LCLLECEDLKLAEAYVGAAFACFWALSFKEYAVIRFPRLILLTALLCSVLAPRFVMADVALPLDVAATDQLSDDKTNIATYTLTNKQSTAYTGGTWRVTGTVEGQNYSNDYTVPAVDPGQQWVISVVTGFVKDLHLSCVTNCVAPAASSQ